LGEMCGYVDLDKMVKACKLLHVDWPCGRTALSQQAYAGNNERDKQLNPDL
jgi:hypothetical protein